MSNHQHELIKGRCPSFHNDSVLDWRQSTKVNQFRFLVQGILIKFEVKILLICQLCENF